MSLFTIFNPETKEIIGEFEFQNYIEAEKFTADNYPEGFVSKHEPFHFNSNFRKMLLKGDHPRIKTNDRGEHVGIIAEDGITILHANSITMGEFDMLRRARIPVKNIGKIEFIRLNNELLESNLNEK